MKRIMAPTLVNRSWSGWQSVSLFPEYGSISTQICLTLVMNSYDFNLDSLPLGGRCMILVKSETGSTMVAHDERNCMTRTAMLFLAQHDLSGRAPQGSLEDMNMDHERDNFRLRSPRHVR